MIEPAKVEYVANNNISVSPTPVNVENTVNVPPRPPVTAELTTDPRTGKKILKAK